MAPFDIDHKDVSDCVMADSSDCLSMDEICEQFSRMKISGDEEDWKTAADFDTGSYIDASDSSSQDTSFCSLSCSGSPSPGNASPFFTSTPDNVPSFSTAFSGSFVDIDDLPTHEVAKALEDHLIDDLCNQFSKLSLDDQEEEDWFSAAEFGASLGSSGSFGFVSASGSFDFHKTSLIVSSTPRFVASISFVLSAALSMASFVDLEEIPTPSVANVTDDQVMKRLREPSFTLSFFEEDEWHTAADIDVSYSGDMSLPDRSIDIHGDVEDNSNSEPEDDCDSEFFDIQIRDTEGRGIRSCRRHFRPRQVRNAKVDTLSISDSVDDPLPWNYKARWSTRPVIIVPHSPIRIISDNTDSPSESSAQVEDGNITPITGGTSHSQGLDCEDDGNACGNDDQGGDMSACSCNDNDNVKGIDGGRGNDKEAGIEPPTAFASAMFSGLRQWLDPFLSLFSSSPSTDPTEPEQWQVPPPLFFGDDSESSQFISSIGYPSRLLPRLPVFSPPRPFYDDLD